MNAPHGGQPPTIRPDATAPGDAEFQRVWQVVLEIGQQERHFNELENRYRSMAAGWVLAIFSAIGFVVSETFQVGIPRWLLIGGIGVAGSAGLLLLWTLDLLFYHQLLEACFVEGLSLEQRHPWLPRIRHNMMQTQFGKGVLPREVAFYVVPIVLLGLVATWGISMWLWADSSMRAAIVVAALGCAAAVGLGWFVKDRTINKAAVKPAASATTPPGA